MYVYGAVIWKKIPFLRLLIPFSAGITTGWYVPITISVLWILMSLFISLVIIFSLLPVRHRFRWRVMNGLAVVVSYFILGGIILHYKNTHVSPHGIRAVYHEKDTLLATLDEPPVEKARSIKAVATVSIVAGTNLQRARGRIIIYFKKNSSLPLQYGQQIMFTI